MDWIMGNYFTVGIVVAYAFIMEHYLRAEAQNDGTVGFKKATILKLTLSSMFCVVGVISYVILINYAHFSNILFALRLLNVFALFAALVGDYFLQFIRLDVKKFKIGILCFSIAQVLLIIPMLVLNLVGWLEFVITVVLLLLFLRLMKKQNWQLGEERKMLTTYTVLLAYMAAKAFTSFLKDMTVGALLFSIGAALFLVSDILLGIWNYNTSKRLHANLNWITYFSGLMLIALSISPEFSTSLIY